MNHVKMAILAAGVSMIAVAAYAAEANFAQVQIKSTALGNNTYMLEGQGGNVIASCGQDGVIQVDGEFAPLHDKIKAEVDKLCGGKPIKYLINTHFHGDHTGGNGPFHRDGTTIVAHQNLALRLEHGSTNGLSGQKTDPAEKDAIPTQTYNTTDGITLQVQGVTAQVKHPPSAHTDTDSYVYFPQANVLATGDTMSTGNRYPTIDYANGGSINGIISTTEAYLAVSNAQTKIVPGHGALATRADLQKYHDMLVQVRDAVQAEIKGGKSEDQAIADKPLAKIGADLKTPQMVDDNMVKMVYRSLNGAKVNPA
jgi:glyoxylase-like metal-dependent hydrolase (beta-lactamase superfamily II)